jgi:SWI/SNF-related matrix-associated actin-dependent regulator of chromatin subfamily A3
LNYFLQVSNIPARCHRLKSPSIPPQFPADISSQDDGSPTFSGIGDSIDVKGHISNDYAQMIHGVLEETSLRFVVLCVVELDRPSKAPEQRCSQRQCHLEITLYGPLELFDEIGSYFESYEVCLQDPVSSGNCSEDVRYCNPHRLLCQDLSSCPLLSDFLAQCPHIAGFEAIAQKPDLLDVLSSHDELEEHPQPRAIQTSLKRLVQGPRTKWLLHFMVFC